MPDITSLLESEIPSLRRYARVLTRDLGSADDLVQSCLVRAIAKQHLWQEGTDLRAWLLTILHNQYVNEVRRSVREGMAVPVEDMASALPIKENATDSLQLRDLHRAMGRLPEEQRQADPAGRSRRHELRAGRPNSQCPGWHGPLAVVARPRDLAGADGREFFPCLCARRR